jgi:hypothetical protein
VFLFGAEVPIAVEAILAAVPNHESMPWVRYWTTMRKRVQEEGMALSADDHQHQCNRKRVAVTRTYAFAAAFGGRIN